MIVRLQSFYGGDPGRWLHVPTGVLRAFISSLPRLVAEENMRWSTVLGVGTGSITKSDRSSILRGWSRDATAGTEVRKPTPEERESMIRAVGIRRG